MFKKGLIFLIAMMLFFTCCASKPDVIVMGENTYYFEEGVENFYVIDIETGERVKVK